MVRLILELQQPVWASGRVETVLRWMEWIRDVTSAEHYGAVAVHGSLIFALLGQPSEAERWAAAAERSSSAGILPDGSTIEATLAYLRAILCRKGIGEMRRDAQLAWEGLSPASPYRATMLYTEGISFLLEGDPTQAGPILARALDLATHSGSLPLAGLILAEQCAVAAERNDWAEVTTLAEQAAAIVENGHFGDYWTSALAYAWASRAAAHAGDVSRARFYLGRASRLRPLLTYALPVVSAQALLEMTRSYITLADPGGAAAVLLRPTTSSGNDPTSASCLSWLASCKPVSPPYFARRRRLVAHGRRAATSAVVVHAPVVRRNRRAAVCLQEHGQDAGVLRLPEARCLLAQRGCRPHA